MHRHLLCTLGGHTGNKGWAHMGPREVVSRDCGPPALATFQRPLVLLKLSPDVPFPSYKGLLPAPVT